VSVRIVPRTLEQRREALVRANKMRVARAGVKHALKDGTRTASGVLAGCEPELENWKVRELLLAVPGWGERAANRALTQCRVSYTKTCGGLSVRQRAELLAYLDGK
jgi:hypothetical protein